MPDGYQQDPLDGLRYRLTQLEQWRLDRDEERKHFQEQWSGRDVDKLRGMLNGYTRKEAVSSFLETRLGKLAAVTVLLTSWGGLVMAVLALVHR